MTLRYGPLGLLRVIGFDSDSPSSDDSGVSLDTALRAYSGYSELAFPFPRVATASVAQRGVRTSRYSGYSEFRNPVCPEQPALYASVSKDNKGEL